MTNIPPTRSDPPERALIYTRTSTLQQGHGPQDAHCRAYAIEHGHEVAQAFADTAASGDPLERPVIKDLLAHIKAHPNERYVVITLEANRISRSLKDQAAFRSALQNAGARLDYVVSDVSDHPDRAFIEQVLIAREDFEDWLSEEEDA